MGTRSLTHIFDVRGNELCCIYQQWDGYLSGVGMGLAGFIESGKLVNGLPCGIHAPEGKRFFNGIECFAARLVWLLKGGEAGGVYLYPIGSSDCGEEFTYHIVEEDAGIKLYVVEEGKRIPWEEISEEDKAA